MENICKIEPKAQAFLKKMGYSKYWAGLIHGIEKKLIRLHVKQGEEKLNDKIVADFIRQQEGRFNTGEIKRATYLSYKKMSEYIMQIYGSGTIINEQYSALPSLPEYFERVLSDILANEEWGVKIRKLLHSRISTFFRWLYGCGYTDLSSVDEHIVHEYLADCSARMVCSSLNEVRKSLKKFFVFLSEDDSLPEGFNKLFLFKIPVEKKIMPFMPQDEITAVLNVIDRNTAKGKRDYAIILLAAITGLRGIDIIELNLDSIDWRNGEIRIVQEKTGKALALPLTADVGMSISDYIMNARPRSESSKVFLKVVAPFGAISTSSINHSLKDYCIKSGISHRGLHSLRRGLATSMITSGVSVITVAQTLGHATINSTKQYISLDSKNLKECALDFNGISVGGKGL
ncbi:MAG: tyrosine-type recombinase/integrase [Oscillospiraceae bacterium]|jgi:site-specific recombinase XerD|nr:tyrosine-type recombinase/integrase [Oscillospiraceae bacterium]